MKKILVLILCGSLASCVSKRVDIEPVSPRSPVVLASPVKAHLKDGSVVVYLNGVTVTADALNGPGTKHDVTRVNSVPVDTVPLSDVIGMESYRSSLNKVETVLYTLANAAKVAGLVMGGFILLLLSMWK